MGDFPSYGAVCYRFKASYTHFIYDFYITEDCCSSLIMFLQTVFPSTPEECGKTRRTRSFDALTGEITTTARSFSVFLPKCANHARSLCHAITQKRNLTDSSCDFSETAQRDVLFLSSDGALTPHKTPEEAAAINTVEAFQPQLQFMAGLVY